MIAIEQKLFTRSWVPWKRHAQFWIRSSGETRRWL